MWVLVKYSVEVKMIIMIVNYFVYFGSNFGCLNSVIVGIKIYVR